MKFLQIIREFFSFRAAVIIKATLRYVAAQGISSDKKDCVLAKTVKTWKNSSLGQIK